MDTNQVTPVEFKPIEGSLQDIEARGLLSKIADMFFKGLDRLFESAAEYEEEMGVLKQVTELELCDAKTDEPTGNYLRIKLSPVKDHEGEYYVEAETDHPDLDLESINKKVIPLNKLNKHALENKIEQLLSGTGLAMMPGNQQASKDNTEESDPELDDIKDKLDDYIKDNFPAFAEWQRSEMVIIQAELYDNDRNPNEEIVEISVVDMDKQKPIKGIKTQEISLKLTKSDGTPLSYGPIEQDLEDQLEGYYNKNNLDSIKVAASSKISATFFKDSKGNVSLTAINSSTDINTAAKTIYAVTEDDDFVAALPEESEVSFDIVDLGDQFNIEEVDSVDTEATYLVLFDATDCLINKIQVFQWALGSTAWMESNLMCELAGALRYGPIDTFAQWVIEHTDRYPTTICEFIAHPDLNEFKIDNSLSLTLIEEDVRKSLDDLLMLYDFHYVNLLHDEQTVLDTIMAELKRIKTYN